MIGLILIAFGTGGIKPCVAAFGGDQFDEEHVSGLRFVFKRDVGVFWEFFWASLRKGDSPLRRCDVQNRTLDLFTRSHFSPGSPVRPPRVISSHKCPPSNRIFSPSANTLVCSVNTHFDGPFERQWVYKDC